MPDTIPRSKTLASVLTCALLGSSCLAEEDAGPHELSDNSTTERQDTLPDERIPYYITEDGTVVATRLAGNEHEDQTQITLPPVPPYDIDEDEAGDTPVAPRIQVDGEPGERFTRIQLIPPDTPAIHGEDVTVTVTQEPTAARFLRKTVLRRIVSPNAIITYDEIASSLHDATDTDDAVIVRVDMCGDNNSCRTRTEAQLVWDGHELSIYDKSSGVQTLIRNDHPFAVLCTKNPSSCSVHDNRGRPKQHSPESYEGGESDRE